MPGSVKVTVPKLKLIGVPAAVPSSALTSVREYRVPAASVSTGAGSGALGLMASSRKQVGIAGQPAAAVQGLLPGKAFSMEYAAGA